MYLYYYCTEFPTTPLCDRLGFYERLWTRIRPNRHRSLIQCPWPWSSYNFESSISGRITEHSFTVLSKSVDVTEWRRNSFWWKSYKRACRFNIDQLNVPTKVVPVHRSPGAAAVGSPYPLELLPHLFVNRAADQARIRDAQELFSFNELQILSCNFKYFMIEFPSRGWPSNLITVLNYVIVLSNSYHRRRSTFSLKLTSLYWFWAVQITVLIDSKFYMLTPVWNPIIHTEIWFNSECCSNMGRMYYGCHSRWQSQLQEGASI